MQVNKFVPPYFQYQPLKKHTLHRFAQDYLQLENKQIQNQLIEFDKRLIEVFNVRTERF